MEATRNSRRLAVSRRRFLGAGTAAAAALLGVAWALPRRASTNGGSSREPQAAAGWTLYGGNPVLGGSLGTCFDVCVLREHGLYRMWFSWRPHDGVGLVESRDGINWGSPKLILGPRHSGWEDRVNRPVVQRTARGYAMWYTGQTSQASAIGYAWSADGILWVRARHEPVLVAAQPWEKASVMCPDVLWDPATARYRMWYSGGDQNEPNAIGHVASRDGLRWERTSSSPIFLPDRTHQWEQQRVTACHVARRDGWYVMFYIGFENEQTARIGLARSRDGIRAWQRHPANPIVRPGPSGSWDADAVYKPYALPDAGGWTLWFNGRSGGMEQIGVARHHGADLGFDD